MKVDFTGDLDFVAGIRASDMVFLTRNRLGLRA